MTIHRLHPWDVTPADARALQSSLAARVDTSVPLGPWRLVAAVDGSYNRFSPVMHAAVVVVDHQTGNIVERVGVSVPAPFPYVPGLLSFREAPAVIAAFERLTTVPDVVLVDGQGIAHPRRLGIASHLGLWLGLPTIGCAKSRLCGESEEPGPSRGDRSSLIHRGEVVGAVLRTRNRIKPLFVSPGHRCDLEGAVALVLTLSGRYRLPEPARMAHDYVNQIRRTAME